MGTWWTENSLYNIYVPSKLSSFLPSNQYKLLTFKLHSWFSNCRPKSPDGTGDVLVVLKKNYDPNSLQTTKKTLQRLSLMCEIKVAVNYSEYLGDHLDPNIKMNFLLHVFKGKKKKIAQDSKAFVTGRLFSRIQNMLWGSFYFNVRKVKGGGND